MQNESSFFWNIFGGLNYFKLWMYEEGLITIEQIVQYFKKSNFSINSKFFLPEIIEREPELFEKEIKHRLTYEYSESTIEELKTLRKKHFKWLRESGDFNDSEYEEIEKNKLRLAIKRDDVDTFQQILSNSNMNVNSKICESTIENFTRITNEMTLLEYAVGFSSIKITKFLIMNDADLKYAIFTAIRTSNYELIHLFESLCKEEFDKISFICSISSWNFEMIEYLLNNYDYSFLEKDELNSDETKQMMNIISDSCFSLNFLFLESTLIPFFKKNPTFLDENINKVLRISIEDYTGFFTCEFLKHPKVNINMNSTGIIDFSLLESSLYLSNSRSFEFILKMPDIDLKSEGYKKLIPFSFACAMSVNTKFIDLLFNHPSFSIDPINALDISALFGASYILKYVINYFNDITITCSEITMVKIVKNGFLYTLKIVLNYYINKNNIFNSTEIIDRFKDCASIFLEFNENVLNDFSRIVHELTLK